MKITEDVRKYAAEQATSEEKALQRVAKKEAEGFCGNWGEWLSV